MAINNWFKISGTFTLPAGTNLRYVVELLADESVTDSEDASTVDPGVFETGTVAESGGTASITTGEIPANSNHSATTNWRFTVYQTGTAGIRRAQVTTHVDLVGSPGLFQTTIDYLSLPTSVGLPVVTNPPVTRLVDLSDVTTPVDTYTPVWDGTNSELDWQAGVAATDADAIHDNVSGEIAAITAKASPVSGDFLLIEDSAAANVKKSITIGDLPTSGQLSDLSDVTSAGVTAGFVLVADGAAYVGRALLEADISDLGTYATFADLTAHTGATTSVHGISDTSQLVTLTTAMNGDVTGTLQSNVVGNDSHDHTSATITLAAADLTDIVSATNTSGFVLVANGTTGYVGRALTEADISDLQTYLTSADIDTFAELDAIVADETLMKQSDSVADLSDVVSATNTSGFVLVANGTTGYVGRALTEADISDLQTYLLASNNLSDVASAATSRTNLGLAIGSDVQAWSAVLDATTASFTTADETKLDGIETAATADQTPAEILAALLTVDGSGSGLDADLLDGLDSTALALATVAPVSRSTSPYSPAWSAISRRLVRWTGSGAATMNLPAAADASGQWFEVRNERTGQVTLDPLGAETIDGQSTRTVRPAGGSFRVWSNGTSWYTVGRFLAATTTNFGTIKLTTSGNIDTGTATDEAMTPATWAGSADKTKLDGIETGATADQSAAEILAALLTVDGTGSGLDADLLDGNEATAFATAAQGALADTALQDGDTAVTLGFDAAATWEHGTIDLPSGAAYAPTGPHAFGVDTADDELTLRNTADTATLRFSDDSKLATAAQGALADSAVQPGDSPAAGDITGSYTAGFAVTDANIDHGSIGGLADDDHTQYLLVDGTRAMTGDLDLGGQNIDNVGAFITDTNGNELMQFTATAGAVNHVRFQNAAAGQRPSFNAAGDDTPDIDLRFAAKGAGVMYFASPLLMATGQDITVTAADILMSSGQVLDVNGSTITMGGGTIDAEAGNNLVAKVGDAAGTNEFRVTDSADAVVWNVDSDGLVTHTGNLDMGEQDVTDVDQITFRTDGRTVTAQEEGALSFKDTAVTWTPSGSWYRPAVDHNEVVTMTTAPLITGSSFLFWARSRFQTDGAGAITNIGPLYSLADQQVLRADTDACTQLLGYSVLISPGWDTLNSGTMTVTNADQIIVEARPLDSGVTLTNRRAITVADAGSAGTVTSQGGVLIADLDTATNNTSVLMGTTTIPSGSWGIYQTEADRPSRFASSHQWAADTQTITGSSPTITIDWDRPVHDIDLNHTGTATVSFNNLPATADGGEIVMFYTWLTAGLATAWPSSVDHAPSDGAWSPTTNLNTYTMIRLTKVPGVDRVVAEMVITGAA